MRIPKKSFSGLGLVIAIIGLGVGCGSSNTTTNPAPIIAADVVIEISGEHGNMSFSPNPASVAMGKTVAWHNADSITHTATADNGSFDTGGIPAGSTSSPMSMSAAGSISYHCAIHPTMVGTLTVH
jgi:plastocyanin